MSFSTHVKHFFLSWGWLLLLVLVASGALLYNLDRQPIQKWDEGIHGSVSLQMIEYNDWLTPRYSDEYYFRKPPLRFWIGAAVFKVFGVNTWTLRLPSAIAGILTAMLIGWWVWQWRRSRLEAFLAGFIFVTMGPSFYHVFRTGETDGLLILWITGALYAWWRATNTRDRAQQWWLVLASIGIAASVLTKSAAALIPILLIAIDFVLNRHWTTIPWRRWIAPIITLFLLTIPWHVFMHLNYGWRFWEDYYGFHILKRATTALHGSRADLFWYAKILWVKFVPHIFWTIGAVIAACIEYRRTRDPFIRFLLIWVAVVLFLFTIARTRAQWYIFPMFPAMVILLAWFIGATRTMRAWGTVFWLHILAFLLLVARFRSIVPAGTRIDDAIERFANLFIHPRIPSIIIGIIILFLCFLTWKYHWEERARRILATIVMAIIILGGLLITFYFTQKVYAPDPLRALMSALSEPNIKVVAYSINFDGDPAAQFLFRQTLQRPGSFAIIPLNAKQRLIEFSRGTSPVYLLSKITSLERTPPPSKEYSFVPIGVYGNLRLWKKQ